MKRAIYVGKPMKAGAFERPALHYGMTGEFHDAYRRYFWPDGAMAGPPVRRQDIYVPSTDQTRHCPKS